MATGESGVTTQRPEPPLTGGEREMLRTFLGYHRATLAMKCEGLTDEELRRQSMPPVPCQNSCVAATWHSSLARPLCGIR